MVDIAYHVSRLVARGVHRRLMKLPAPARGIVSISFDDFPASAGDGADLLYREGARGTFYLCTGRIDTVGSQGRIADEALIRRLSDAGHEIGCHTRSHLRAVDTPGATYRADLAANREALHERFGVAAKSFAYPYGSVTPAAKAAAGALYRTSRTTAPGINRGTFDANFLLANPLYGTAATDRVMALLRHCAAHGGWLIFYTHDVSDLPSAHGCRSNLLEEVLRIAKAGGCQILPVGEVQLLPA